MKKWYIVLIDYKSEYSGIGLREEKMKPYKLEAESEDEAWVIATEYVEKETKKHKGSSYAVDSILDFETMRVISKREVS